MFDRIVKVAIVVLALHAAVQLVPAAMRTLGGVAWAGDAAFGGPATAVVSTYDETWEASEFLGHDLGADVDFRSVEGSTKPFVVADVPQKLYERSAPMKTRVLWRREEANSAVLPTLMVTRWRVTGHIHAQ